jgi:hypothetical protein
MSGRSGFSCGRAERGRGGDVAQLVERLLCKQDVRSSNLLVSKKVFRSANPGTLPRISARTRLPDVRRFWSEREALSRSEIDPKLSATGCLRFGPVT